MKYADLINVKDSVQLSNIRMKPTSNGAFIQSSPKWYQSFPYEKIYKNWKARISIHPEDLDKAWEIIFPLLAKENVLFKVTNRNFTEEFSKGRKMKLDKLLKEHEHYSKHKRTLTIESLRQLHGSLHQNFETYKHNQWRLMAFIQRCWAKLSGLVYNLTLSKERLSARTEYLYQCLINLRKERSSNSLRFCEGMQFTIYIRPGDEKNCQDMLESIEIELINQKIRVGKIFPTDRQIGIYSSIRHPGKWYYHEATSSELETYNPDNVEDPFDFLKTCLADDVMSPKDAQTFLESNSALEIITALMIKKHIAPAFLKSLAVHKEKVVEYIETSPFRDGLIEAALNKSTNLGMFFRVPRGMFTPRLGHGTLKQLETMKNTPHANALTL